MPAFRAHFLNRLSRLEIHSEKPDEEFNELSLSLFRRQFETNPTYQNYCLARKKNPETVSRWQEIPAVVTDVFKSPKLSLKSGNWESARTFHTSGTTGSQTGRHHFASLDAYQQSVLQGWSITSIGKPQRAFFLDRPAREKPHSSLTAMFDILAQDWQLDDSCWLRKESGEFDFPRLKSYANQDSPLFLFGTALSFIELFSQGKLSLPLGSQAMETGGYKGSGITISKDDLYADFTQHLGIDTDQVWNEYSMTELSSQFYTRGLDQAHYGPAWTRFRIIDPETGQDAPSGQLGYLVIYDLANIDSVQAIQTQDLAMISEDGRGFYLVGRDPSALPRGCSRAI